MALFRALLLAIWHDLSDVKLALSQAVGTARATLLVGVETRRYKAARAPTPGRRLAGIGPSRRMSVIGGRGDRQNPADRLDPVTRRVIVDEGDQLKWTPEMGPGA